MDEADTPWGRWYELEEQLEGNLHIRGNPKALRMDVEGLHWGARVHPWARMSDLSVEHIDISTYGRVWSRVLCIRFNQRGSLLAHAYSSHTSDNVDSRALEAEIDAHLEQDLSAAHDGDVPVCFRDGAADPDPGAMRLQVVVMGSKALMAGVVATVFVAVVCLAALAGGPAWAVWSGMFGALGLGVLARDPYPRRPISVSFTPHELVAGSGRVRWSDVVLVELQGSTLVVRSRDGSDLTLTEVGHDHESDLQWLQSQIMRRRRDAHAETAAEARLRTEAADLTAGLRRDRDKQSE